MKSWLSSISSSPFLREDGPGRGKCDVGGDPWNSRRSLVRRESSQGWPGGGGLFRRRVLILIISLLLSLDSKPLKNVLEAFVLAEPSACWPRRPQASAAPLVRHSGSGWGGTPRA